MSRSRSAAGDLVSSREGVNRAELKPGNLHAHQVDGLVAAPDATGLGSSNLARSMLDQLQFVLASMELEAMRLSAIAFELH